MKKTAADVCRENGWGVGTVLVCRDTTEANPVAWWEYRWRVTAVGEQRVLGVEFAARDWLSPEWSEYPVPREDMMPLADSSWTWREDERTSFTRG